MTALNALIGPLMVQEMFRRAGLEPVPPPVDARQHVRAFLEGRTVGP
jgi:hypothetical protein